MILFVKLFSRTDPKCKSRDLMGFIPRILLRGVSLKRIKMKLQYLIATVIFLVAITTSSFAQTTDLVQLKNTEQFVLKSDYFKEEPFTIEVCLPKNYDPAKSYPVVYLLDADKSIGMAKDIGDWLMWGKQIQDIIIVGIAYDKDDNTWWINRSRDYLPTSDTITEFGKAFPKAGGGDNFLDFIQFTLVPEINKRYSVNSSETGIIGFSFGGTLATYALFTRPELFKNFMIISPGLSWDNSLILTIEKEFYQDHKTLNKKVFISISSDDPEVEVKSPTTIFIDNMIDRDYKGLDFIHEYFENETHPSGYPRAITTGLSKIYAR